MSISKETTGLFVFMSSIRFAPISFLLSLYVEPADLPWRLLSFLTFSSGKLVWPASLTSDQPVGKKKKDKRKKQTAAVLGLVELSSSQIGMGQILKDERMGE